MATCLIGLGSNLGDCTENIQQAIRLLSAEAGRLLAQSTLHTTRSIGGPTGQADFCNAVALLETNRLPLEMLAALQRIEQQLGRQRIERWGPRSLDLDLLLYDQSILDTPALVVPHPRLAFRRFVLSPAAEIAAEMIHPTTGFSLQELLTRLDNKPVHVSVIGVDATMIAWSAARQINAVFLEHPAMKADGSSDMFKTLEFLVQGARLWDAIRSEHVGPVISDFWIGWVESDDHATAQPWSECQAVWRDMPPQLIAPHLVVWLEPVDWPAQDQRKRMRRIVFPRRQFPVLTLRDVGIDVAVAEITAAVEAMRS